ncbi:MAG: D-alanyl-D-alanine carboxypeptidase family protein [Microthrixaceae bacterium]
MLRSVAAVAVGLIAVTVVPATAWGDDPSGLDGLRAQREQVRARQAEQASQVDALRASAADAEAALGALNRQVNAQQDRVEEAERAVTRAESDQRAAEEAQARAAAELDRVRGELRTSAVEAYIDQGSTRPPSAVGVRDVNDAMNKRTLIALKANERADLIETYRSVQEDLELQRAAAAAAAAEARDRRGEVTDRMRELRGAVGRQREFASQLEARVDRALGEAEALAAVDGRLAAEIGNKEAELARALAAQRAEEEARAARRVAAGGDALVGDEDTAGDGGGAPPSIVGAGEIVTVGGIAVHRSIAADVQALLAAAAADGISLSGGGFRDPSQQVALRRKNCGTSDQAVYQASPSSCRPPTARPGSSMHERGLAIDFKEGGSALTRSSAGFRWLQANAGRFGLRNLPSEPWHWSTTGQ